MPDLPTRLALSVPAPCVCREVPLCNQHIAIVRVIREALEEAEKVTRQFGQINYPTTWPGQTNYPTIWLDEITGSLDRTSAKVARMTSENIAAAIATLRGVEETP